MEDIEKKDVECKILHKIMGIIVHFNSKDQDTSVIIEKKRTINFVNFKIYRK